MTADEDFTARTVAQPEDHPKLNWQGAEQAGARAMGEQAALHHFTIARPYGMEYIPEYGAYGYGARSSLDIRSRRKHLAVAVARHA